MGNIKTSVTRTGNPGYGGSIDGVGIHNDQLIEVFRSHTHRHLHGDEGEVVGDFPSSDIEESIGLYLLSWVELLQQPTAKSGWPAIAMFRHESIYKDIFTSEKTKEAWSGWRPATTMREFQSTMQAWCSEKNYNWFWLPISTARIARNVECAEDAPRHPEIRFMSWFRIRVFPATTDPYRWAIDMVAATITYGPWSTEIYYRQEEFNPLSGVKL